MNRSRAGMTMLEVLVTLAIISLILAILLPAVQYARESARRTDCSNRLRQIGIAVHLFSDSYHKLPFSSSLVGIYEEKGAHFVSWRVQLLQFMEETDLANAYRKDQDWNSEQNSIFISKMPTIFACPSGNPAEMGESAFEAIMPLKNRRFDFYKKINDMTSQTVIVAETNASFAVPWTKSGNMMMLPFFEQKKVIDPSPMLSHRAFFGNHGRTFHVLFADGRVDRVGEIYDDEDRRYWKVVTDNLLNPSNRFRMMAQQPMEHSDSLF